MQQNLVAPAQIARSGVILRALNGRHPLAEEHSNWLLSGAEALCDEPQRMGAGQELDLLPGRTLYTS